MGNPTTRGGSSVIVQPVGSQTAPTTLTRNGLAIRQVQFSAESLKDSAELYRVLTNLQRNYTDALRTVGTSPIVEVNIIRAVVFQTGQTQMISHGLGRAYQGWMVVRAQGLVASMVEGALLAGLSATQVLPLTSANAGTYDIMVF